MRTSSLQVASQDIVRLFDRFPQKVFTESDLDRIVDGNRKSWRLAKSVTTSRLIEFLMENSKLDGEQFNFPHRKAVRYVWGQASVYELALSLHSQAYFTHLTAMHIHNLADNPQKAIYVNIEQPPKPRFGGALEQERIDLAFKRPVRVSKQFTSYKGTKMVLLSGMYTGQLGVTQMLISSSESARVTNLERTLIDATVRPVYSGGVSEVLHAYKAAQSTLDVKTLSEILSKLNYAYPYHQAVGYYLERAGGYTDSQISLFRKYQKNYDFYLAHQMGEVAYSKEWRLFYPRGL